MSKSSPRHNQSPGNVAEPRRTSRTRQQPASPPRKWRVHLIVCTALVLSVFAIYSQVGQFFFITFDDPLYVSENLHVRAGLTPENAGWAFSTVVDSNWIPLTLLSHMAVCQFFGLESSMHHWVNVVFHALAAVLLYAALRRATGALWPSAFVGFVFALHPLHVESVAWISERKDVLSTFFWFLALYAYVLYAELPTARRYFLTIALFCLGLMAKPMLVTFPFTLLLLDVWPLRRAKFPRILWEKAPFFAISAAFSAVAYMVQRSSGAMRSAPPLGGRVENALISYVGYVGQMFWPTGLAMFYPHRTWINAWYAIGAVIVIVGISSLAVFAWRTRPYIATGWFWYLGTLVPVIGFVQVGVQSHADRYMYIPMVGLSIMLAWGAADAVRKWPQARSAVVWAGVASCVICFGMASAQAQYWRDSEAAYRRAIDVTKDNFVAEYSLADYLSDIPGRGAEAAAHFERALRIQPDSATAHNGLGSYFLETGRDAEAVSQFEAALRTDPTLAAAHFNLGLIYARNPQRVSQALAHYQAAVRYSPDFARGRKELGTLLLTLGRIPEAITQFQAAQRIQPDAQTAQVLRALEAGHR